MKEWQDILYAKNFSKMLLEETCSWLANFRWHHRRPGRVDARHEEMHLWLTNFRWQHETADDDEFLGEVWQEVGDHLRDAMKQYPLEQAAADAGLPIPSKAR